MSPEWAAITAASTCVAGFLLDRVLHRPARTRLGQVVSRFEQFLDDWDGEPERRTPDGQVVLEQRRPGMPERMGNVESDVAEVKRILNGGGLGHQVAELDQKVTATTDQLLEDIQGARRLVGEAVTVLTTQQQRIEERVDGIDRKVDDRLFVLEDTERAHRAMLQELGMDLDEPLDPADAPED